MPLFFSTQAPERSARDSVGIHSKLSFLKIFLRSLKSWWCSESFDIGAALAYYVVFSMGPALLIVVAIAGTIFGEEAARGVLFKQLEGVLGAPIAASVQSLLATTRFDSSNLAASLIGGGTVLVGATGFFAHLRRSLNVLWNVKPRSSGIWVVLRRRLIAFLGVVSLGVLLMVLLAIDTGISAFGGHLAQSVPLSSFVLRVISFVISLGLLTLVFALIFKFLSDANFPWKSIWLGSLITAFLFSVGKVVMSLYLGKTSVASVYGAAGSVIIILLSAYYFSQIIFMGAEFIKTYSGERS